MPELIPVIRDTLHSCFKFWAKSETDQDYDWRHFLVQLGSLLAIFVFFHKILVVLTQLPQSAFSEPVIFWELIKKLFTHPLGLTLVIGVFIILLLRIPPALQLLNNKWSDFQHGNSLRFFVVLTAGVLSWVFATYDFNLYLNQAHLFDRLLLILFCVLIIWRPVFVFPFLALLLPIISQFEILAGFSWAAPLLPIKVLILFAAFLFLRILIKISGITVFVFLLGCLWASHYWVSGIAKLTWEWILHDQVYFLLPATYANGWLSFLEPETISKLCQNFIPFNGIMKFFTILMECGCLIFFWRLGSLRFFLFGWILFHLGILLMSGIFFWMWMVLEAGLLFLFLRRDSFSSLALFNYPKLLISVILIITASYWSNPVRLAWHDAPVSYTYRFEAETQSGNKYFLPPNFFAPYDYQFTLMAFSFMSPHPVLPIVWGVTSDPGLSRQLEKMSKPEHFFSYEKERGFVGLQEDRIAGFDAFVRQFVQHWNQRLSKKTGLSYLKAPRLLWTFPSSPGFAEPEAIKQIKVIQVTSVYFQGQYSEIRHLPVQKILIPD